MPTKKKQNVMPKSKAEKKNSVKKIAVWNLGGLIFDSIDQWTMQIILSYEIIKNFVLDHLTSKTHYIDHYFMSYGKNESRWIWLSLKKHAQHNIKMLRSMEVEKPSDGLLGICFFLDTHENEITFTASVPVRLGDYPEQLSEQIISQFMKACKLDAVEEKHIDYIKIKAFQVLQWMKIPKNFSEQIKNILTNYISEKPYYVELSKADTDHEKFSILIQSKKPNSEIVDGNSKLQFINTLEEMSFQSQRYSRHAFDQKELGATILEKLRSQILTVIDMEQENLLKLDEMLERFGLKKEIKNMETIPLSVEETPLANEIEAHEFTQSIMSMANQLETPASISIEKVENKNWKAVIKDVELLKNINIENLSFANDMEKHLALQLLSITNSNLNLLSGAMWPVWRNLNAAGYSLNGKERYPETWRDEKLTSQMMQLMMMISPLLVKLFWDQFSIAKLENTLSTDKKGILLQRKPLQVREGILGNIGLKNYADRITKGQYNFYHLSGIQKLIFFDGLTKSIYLDEDYYSKQPPSHLFHRLMGIMWSVELGYFVPIALDPIKEVYPVIKSIYEILFSSKKYLLWTGYFGLSADPVIQWVAQKLSRSERKKIKEILRVLGGSMEPEDLEELWHSMNYHVYRLLLTETLDFIGLVEAITDKNLFEEPPQEKDILRLESMLKPLVDFALELKVA